MCVHAPVEVASASFSVEKDSKMESSTTLAVVSELLSNNKEKLGWTVENEDLFNPDVYIFPETLVTCHPHTNMEPMAFFF